MRRFVISAGITAILLFAVARAHAGAITIAGPTITNGDFEAQGVGNGDPNGFNTWPGYVGQGGNPTQVTGFTGPSGGYGLNNATSGIAPFTDNGNDYTNVLFIQGEGTTLTQNISGFTVGATYNLDFEYNARNCCGGTAGLQVSIGTASFDSGGITPVGGNNPYYYDPLTFVALSPTETLTITKYNFAPGDSTALLDNLVLTQVSSPVPEPASLTLLGLGGLGLVLARRRKLA